MNSEESILCQVCFNGDVENENEIVICHKCGTAVHQACYGITSIPQLNWYCETCSLNLESDSTPIKYPCPLCPNYNGAFKRITDSNSYVHVCCALVHHGPWVIGDDKMISISGLELINAINFSYRCKICKEVNGACIGCEWPRCLTKFHVSCAYNSDEAQIYILDTPNSPKNTKPKESEESASFISYCQKHNKEVIKKINSPDLLESGIITVSQLKNLFKTKKKKSLVKIEIQNGEQTNFRKYKNLCEICCSREGLLITCENCSTQVHENCYYPLKKPTPIPSRYKTKTFSNSWFCDFCFLYKINLRKKYQNSCLICNRTGSALKLTIEGDFIHLVCAVIHCDFKFLHINNNFISSKISKYSETNYFISPEILNINGIHKTIVLDVNFKKHSPIAKSVCVYCSKGPYNGTLETCLFCNTQFHAFCAIEVQSVLVILDFSSQTVYYANHNKSFIQLTTEEQNKRIINKTENTLINVICFNCKKGVVFDHNKNHLAFIEKSYAYFSFTKKTYPTKRSLIKINYNPSNKTTFDKSHISNSVLFDVVLNHLINRDSLIADISSTGRLLTHHRAEFSLAKTKSSDKFWDSQQQFIRPLTKTDFVLINSIFDSFCIKRVIAKKVEELDNYNETQNKLEESLCECIKCFDYKNSKNHYSNKSKKFSTNVLEVEQPIQIILNNNNTKTKINFYRSSGQLELPKTDSVTNLTEKSILTKKLLKLTEKPFTFLDTTSIVPNINKIFNNLLHSSRVKLLTLLLNSGLNDVVNFNKHYLLLAKPKPKSVDFCTVCFSRLRIETDIVLVKCDYCLVKAHKVCAGELSSVYDTSTSAVWTCENCLNNQKFYSKKANSEEKSCAFCHFEGLLIKPSVNGIFAHILCFLAETNLVEIVDIISLSFFVKNKTVYRKSGCSVCRFGFKQGEGLPCGFKDCNKRFHALCAWKYCCLFDFSETFYFNSDTKLYCSREHISPENSYYKLFNSNYVNFDTLRSLRERVVEKEFEEYSIINIQPKNVVLREEDLIFSPIKEEIPQIPIKPIKPIKQIRPIKPIKLSKPTRSSKPNKNVIQPKIIKESVSRKITRKIIKEEIQTPIPSNKISIYRGSTSTELNHLDSEGLTLLNTFENKAPFVLQLRNINSVFPFGICSICFDIILIIENFTLLRCHCCGVFVHEECYFYGRGRRNFNKTEIPLKPKNRKSLTVREDFLAFSCDLCKFNESNKTSIMPSCAYCNVKGASFIIFNKILIHAACIFWNIEVRNHFLEGNYEFLLQNLNKKSRPGIGKTCYICKSGEGKLVRCVKEMKFTPGVVKRCERRFHVTCGILANCNIFYIYESNKQSENIFCYCTAHVNALEVVNETVTDKEWAVIKDDILTRSKLLFIDTIIQKEKTKTQFRMNELFVFYNNYINGNKSSFSISKFEYGEIVFAVFLETEERKLYYRGKVLKKRVKNDKFDYYIHFYDTPVNKEEKEDKDSGKSVERKEDDVQVISRSKKMVKKHKWIKEVNIESCKDKRAWFIKEKGTSVIISPEKQ